MKIRTPWPLWFAVGAVVLVMFSLPFWFNKGPTHQRLLASIPMGADVQTLRSLSQNSAVSGSTVMQWIPSSRVGPDRDDIQLFKDGVTIQNEFGIFLQKDLGDYGRWSLTRDVQSSFTGEIVFFVDRPLGNVVMIGFSYVQGRLVKKDWGYLPG